MGDRDTKPDNIPAQPKCSCIYLYCPVHGPGRPQPVPAQPEHDAEVEAIVLLWLGEIGPAESDGCTVAYALHAAVRAALELAEQRREVREHEVFNTGFDRGKAEGYREGLAAAEDAALDAVMTTGRVPIFNGVTLEHLADDVIRAIRARGETAPGTESVRQVATRLGMALPLCRAAAGAPGRKHAWPSSQASTAGRQRRGGRVMDWEKAKAHFDAVRKLYQELEGSPGVNTTIALRLVFAPLASRYNAGERTQELHDAMMAVE
jgi:hypothetical protein